MKIVPCEQGSPEWFAARLGIPSASNFDRIITAKQMKLAAAHEDYINELIAERLTKVPRPEGFVSLAMKNGIETEPAARAWYAMERDHDVSRVGFCLTEDGRFGCSPDGISRETCPTCKGQGGTEATSGPDAEPASTCPHCLGAGEIVGALELKCPDGKTHVGYLRDGVLPSEYKAQTHGELIVTGAAWVDFMSYHPEMPGRSKAFLIRVFPDDFTDALRKCLEAFWDNFQAALAKIEAM